MIDYLNATLLSRIFVHEKGREHTYSNNGHTIRFRNGVKLAKVKKSFEP